MHEFDTFQIATRYAKIVNREKEHLLIERVEEIEGRVPTNEEIGRHTVRVIQLHKETWCWKKMPIVEVDMSVFPFVVRRL